jgi:cytochrome P450
VSDLYYDPYDYGIDADPHPVWKRLRDEAPVYRNEKHDFYALSRFQDVLEASLADNVYSSAYGTVLDLMNDEPNQSPMMIWKDGRDHGTLRALVSRAFSPRRIQELEPQVREIARQYLDGLQGRDHFDFLEDFGAKLPVMVISTLLGVPEADREQIRVWTDALLHRDAELAETGRAHGHHEDVSGQLWGYFGRYVDERRAKPQDDMMSDLIAAEIEGEDGEKRKLSEVELLAFIGLLSGAGNETVARLLGWVATLFARFPGERRKLVQDPALIPNAVEELLRYEAPSPVQGRRIVRDVELHGQTMKAGSNVLLLTASAGRDEREYADPDRLDVSRKIERHVTLGYGRHFCLGASLARMEGRIAIEEVLARFPEWDVDWDATEMVHTSTVRGYAKVPVRIPG